MSVEGVVLLLHAGATLMMTGLIWFVQVVHYPLFSAVGVDGAPRYAAAHQRLTTRVVGPLMLLEGAGAVWLAARPPTGVPALLPIAGLALLAVIWGATALAQVPCHRRLSQGFDEATHRRLVRTNWVRTIGWSLRSIAALAMLTP